VVFLSFAGACADAVGRADAVDGVGVDRGVDGVGRVHGQCSQR
jgi:hypothetical protein